MSEGMFIDLEWHGPKITEEDVTSFEDVIGVELPEDYRRFLLTCNGGRPSLKNTFFSFGRGNTRADIFYSLKGTSIDLSRVRNDLQHRLPPDLLAIGNDEGGSLICIAIRGERAGEVWFFDTLDPHEPKMALLWHERKRDFRRLADSFTDFLGMLRPDED